MQFVLIRLDLKVLNEPTWKNIKRIRFISANNIKESLGILRFIYGFFGITWDLWMSVVSYRRNTAQYEICAQTFGYTIDVIIDIYMTYLDMGQVFGLIRF